MQPHAGQITLTLATALVAAAAASSQVAVVNEKILHNTQHTDSTTRFDSNKTDTLYFMQPTLSRTGYGKAKGWRGVLQDQDYRTAETVQFAFVKYASNMTDPDVTAAGLIGNASGQLQFPQPASGTVSAAVWTITLRSSVDVPSHHGYRMVFPPAKSSSDGVSVHTQLGRSSQLPNSLRKQWTWYLTSTNLAAAFWEAGTTLHWGGIYDEPVAQMFIESTLYSKQEKLYGPEALYPSATAGDKIGFRLTGEAFKSQFAVLLISGGLIQRPIQTPFGDLLLMPPGGVINLAFKLDQNGQIESPTVPTLPKLKIWSQAAFLDIATGTVRLSDATGIEAQ